MIKHRHYSDTDIMLSSRYFPKGGLLDDDVLLPSCCTSSLLVVNWIAGCPCIGYENVYVLNVSWKGR